MTRRNLLLAAAASAVSAIGLGGWAVVPAAIGFPLAIVAARVRVRHSRWAEVDRAVAYRSGWWTRRTSIVPTTKIQVVTLAESPFDRRRRMARVLVDTAGAGRVGHRVFVPYLDQPIARGLHARLASRAAATAFRW